MTSLGNWEDSEMQRSISRETCLMIEQTKSERGKGEKRNETHKKTIDFHALRNHGAGHGRMQQKG